jgi:3-hydroxyisobutyrate dehydrogenase
MTAAQASPPGCIGFVGLGQMGAPMARNLARAGFALAVADASADAVERLAAEVACVVPADLKSLGASCPVVITMLPDGSVVRNVAIGDGGDALAAGLAPGSVLIDMSSSSPVGTRSLGRALAERGIALVDAPVSGGVKKAIDGSLSIMAGGDPDTIERVRPVLAAMGRQIFLTGPLGSGHAMKALNNYVSAAGLAAAAEAVLAGSRFGLDPATMVAILNASTGKNNSTENKFPQFVLPRRFASGFSLGLMVKDLRTALDVAHAAGTPAPLGEACVEAWARAEALLGGQADHTAVVQYWERLAGAEIPKREG